MTDKEKEIVDKYSDARDKLNSLILKLTYWYIAVFRITAVMCIYKLFVDYFAPEYSYPWRIAFGFIYYPGVAIAYLFGLVGLGIYSLATLFWLGSYFKTRAFFIQEGLRAGLEQKAEESQNEENNEKDDNSEDSEYHLK